MQDEIKPEPERKKQFEPGWYKYRKDRYKPIRKDVEKRTAEKYDRQGLEKDSPQFRIARGQEARSILRTEEKGDIDVLTGLYNRNGTTRRLTEVINNAKRNHTSFAIIFLDLNNLKEINDTISHELGDATLQATASALKADTKPGDIVGRYGGGDEVMIVLPGTDIEGAKIYMERKKELLKYLSAWASAGISQADVNDIQKSINMAEAAMYQAKREAKEIKAKTGRREIVWKVAEEVNSLPNS